MSNSKFDNNDDNERRYEYNDNCNLIHFDDDSERRYELDNNIHLIDTRGYEWWKEFNICW